jgi:hypothetical protein
MRAALPSREKRSPSSLSASKASRSACSHCGDQSSPDLMQEENRPNAVAMRPVSNSLDWGSLMLAHIALAKASRRSLSHTRRAPLWRRRVSAARVVWEASRSPRQAARGLRPLLPLQQADDVVLLRSTGPARIHRVGRSLGHRLRADRPKPHRIERRLPGGSLSEPLGCALPPRWLKPADPSQARSEHSPAS